MRQTGGESGGEFGGESTGEKATNQTFLGRQGPSALPYLAYRYCVIFGLALLFGFWISFVICAFVICHSQHPRLAPCVPCPKSPAISTFPPKTPRHFHNFKA